MLVLVVYLVSFVFFFFFKQKTAYEMRISDWSSDVCSSDLRTAPAALSLPDGLLLAGFPGAPAAASATGRWPPAMTPGAAAGSGARSRRYCACALLPRHSGVRGSSRCGPFRSPPLRGWLP